MQGWSGVGAFVAGVLAALFTAALLMHEMRESRRLRLEASEDRQEARRDRERIDAERRDVEMRHARAVVVRRHGGETEKDPVTYTVINHGAGPILDLTAYLIKAEDEFLQHEQILGPGESVVIKGQFYGKTFVSWQNLLTDPIRLTFTDMEGRLWRRSHNRQPEVYRGPLPAFRLAQQAGRASWDAGERARAEGGK